MILYYFAGAAAALYQLCYLLHCIGKRQTKAAVGAALQTAVSVALIVLMSVQSMR